jgi:regulator of cell morphogenesis and NO signaling
MYSIETVSLPETRLADIVLRHPLLLDALRHLHIPMGFGEQSIREVAAAYALPEDALLAIVNTYCERPPLKKPLHKEGLVCLLRFLETSHEDFRANRIPRLKELIAAFAAEIPAERGKMLVDFFQQYIHEIFAHFAYEEQTVFPYVQAVLNARPATGYAIKNFKENHTDIEEKLYDLQSILVKYIPEAPDSVWRMRILHHLFFLERQLACHTNLENLVLVPSVKKLESCSNS